MRFFAILAVLGCLAFHAAFAAGEKAATASAPAKPAPSGNSAPSNGAANSGDTKPAPPAPVPSALTLTITTDRDPGWCATSKGPATLPCIGPDDTVIATAGSAGEGLEEPVLCIDQSEIPSKRAALGGNRFRFKIDGWTPPEGVEGHRVFLAAALTGPNPSTAQEGKSAKCAKSVTQLVDVAVRHPCLLRTGAGLTYLGLALAILALVSRFPSFLKDPDSANAPTRPWSLGRVQLAWWTAIVFAGWIVILLSTLNYKSFTAETLILLGVSAATTATAVTVQAGKEQEKAKADALTAEKVTLQGSLNAAALTTPEMVVAGQRLQQIAAETAVAPDKQKYKNFFADLLKDGEDLSLARLQAVLWTVALGGIFVWQVLANMVMPAFPKELLFLAGISSGTYLFGKIGERHF